MVAPPRSSVYLSTAGEELRACLLLARDTRQRSACFAGFSLQDLLAEDDLVRQSRSRVVPFPHPRLSLFSNNTGALAIPWAVVAEWSTAPDL